MIVKKSGQSYLLESYGKEGKGQTLEFTAKSDSGYIDGTTNEEVVSMLLDRFLYLNEQAPSNLNETLISLTRSMQRILAARLEHKQLLTNKRKWQQHE
jgi:hypothetical protein